MAKKKAAPAGAKKPTAAPQKSFRLANNTAAAGRTVSNDEIGAASGEVWQLLHQRGEQTLAALKKGVDAPADLVVAAVGWLAREGKLEFASSGRTVKISLR